MFNTSHTKNLVVTSKRKKIVAGILLFIQLFSILLVPVTASAAAVYPGTPQKPTKVENVCFTASQSLLGYLVSYPYCYSTIAACKVVESTVPAALIESRCMDNSDTMSTWERFSNGSGTFSAVGERIFDKATQAIADAIAFLAEMINELASIFLEAMAFILDASIDRTINTATYKDLAVVNIGWAAVRDMTNMFFIFVLLYIAILTVVGSAGANAKRWVASLIIAAIMINFSLFLTQVVIDTGNVLAKGFWSKMVTTQGKVSGSSAAASLMQGFKIQTVYDTTNTATATTTQLPSDAYHRAMINLGGALVMFLAGYVFLAGAIMMVIRTVTLLIVMIASPFAFLGFALPKGGGFATEWLNKLTGATFVAPVFLFMLWLDSIIITSTDAERLTSGAGKKWGAAIVGQVDNYMIIYNFAVMMILVYAALYVSQKVSNGVGSSAAGYAKKGLGYGGAAAFATGGFAMRRTVGASADRIKNNENLQKAAQQTGLRGMMARTALRTANVGAKASFDVRGAPGMKGLSQVTGVGFGAAAGAGGERARRQAKDAATVKKAEELFPNNPVAQQNYIRNATRTVPGVGNSRFDQKPGEFASKEDKMLKEKKTTLDKEERIKADKEALKSKIEEASKTGQAIGEATAKEIKELFVKLGAKESLDSISMDKVREGELTNVAELFNKQMLAAMAADQDKYQAPLDKVSKAIMSSNNNDSRQYIIQQKKMQSPAYQSVDLNDELKNTLGSYDALGTLPANATPAEREKYFKSRDEYDGAVQDIMGAMKPKEIARLDNTTKSHESVVRNYTDKHFNEIESYHQNIMLDSDAPEQKSMFANMRKTAETKGTKSTQEYMKKARKNSGSAFYDHSAGVAAKKELGEKLASAEKDLADARKNLDEANKSGLPGRKSDAENAYKKAERNHSEAKRANDAGVNTSQPDLSGGDTDDDEVA